MTDAAGDDPLGVTLLTAKDGAVLTKRRFGPKPADAQDYDRPRLFAFRAARFDWALVDVVFQTIDLAGRPDMALVRAAPVLGLDLKRPHRRLLHPDRKTGDAATLREVPRSWAMFDFDGLAEPEVDWRDDPEAAALAALDAVLPPWLREADYVASYTGSHGFKSGMRLRSLHLLDTPLLGSDLRALLQGVPMDPALTRPIQLHYTARPIFGRRVADPLPGAARFALALGRKRRRAAVPPVPAPPPPPEPVRRTRPAHRGEARAGSMLRVGRTVRLGATGDGLDAVMPKSAGGPGRHRGTQLAVAAFMRREGADADPEPLIADCVARAASFGASELYLRQLADDAHRFAAWCAARQRGEAVTDFEAVPDDDAAVAPVPRGDANAPPRDQRAMRALLGITFLDKAAP